MKEVEPGSPLGSAEEIGVRYPPSPDFIRAERLPRRSAFFCLSGYSLRFPVVDLSASGLGASDPLLRAMLLSLRAAPRFFAADASFFCWSFVIIVASWPGIRLNS